ncbi:MAG TPA: hypothetical protein PKE04_19825 [Clostridia bacterium]|nr:hypothetical protein [Clostridia bacterium]
MKKLLSMLLVGALALTMIALPAAVAEEATDITMFMYASSPFPADAENPIGLKIQEATNTVLHTETPPSSSYSERLQILLASGDYPEVVMFPSHTENLYPKIRDISWNAMKVNGEIYGIPQATVMRADGYFVRKDWVDALGVALPEDGYLTLDEMYDLLHKLTYDDPDGNGKADTFGIVATATSDGALSPLFQDAFDLMGWQKYEDEEYPYMNLQYSRTNPAFKDALAFTAKLWAEGLIDPDWPAMRADDTSKERFNQGVGGMRNAFAGQYTNYLDIMNQNIPQADLTYIAGVESASGNRNASVAGTGYWYLSALTVAAEGKEQAIIDMFDYRMSDEGWDLIKYGVEGTHFDFVNGERVFNESYNDYYKWRGSYKLVMPSMDSDYFINPALDTALKAKLSGWLQQAVDRVVTTADLGYRPAAADLPEYIEYVSKVNANITKIIIGELPVDAWDDTLAGWYANGGEAYVQQMNEYIQSHE